MKIRDATANDAEAACEVLRKSISELCVADHRNDPALLGRWLGNKTPAIVARWALLVALDDKTIVAVGAVRDSGEITLNYVAPAAEFTGVSSAMPEALEARAAARGATRCTVTSTETAHRFYLSRGYADAPRESIGTNSGYRMSRVIAGS